MIETILTMVLATIRIVVVGCALGTAFIRLRLFNRLHNEHVLLVGIVTTPYCLSFVDYLLGFAFIGWPTLFFYFVPVIASAFYCFLGRRYRIIIDAIKDLRVELVQNMAIKKEWLLVDMLIAIFAVLRYAIAFNNRGLLKSIFYSLNTMSKVVILLFAFLVMIALLGLARKMHRERVLTRNLYAILFFFIICYSFFYGMSFNGRADVDSDRTHYQLDARYFAEDRNSYEVDNYSDEKYGSSLRDDHGPLWTLYLSDAQMLAGMMGITNPVRVCNYYILWVYYCFGTLLFLSASIIANSYKAGILSICLMGLYQYDVLMIFGSRDAFRFLGLLILFLYLYSLLQDIGEEKARWYHYLFVALFSYASINGHEGNVYIMLGLYIAVMFIMVIYRSGIRKIVLLGFSALIGTLIGIYKTIVIYVETGRLSSSTILPFHGTPIESQVAEINNNRADWNVILDTYTWQIRLVIGLGLCALILLIISSIRNKNKPSIIISIMIAGMLLPMTGVMDWLGYEVSRWFAEQLRYRMYFLMIFAMTGAWILTVSKKRCTKIISCVGIIFILVQYVSVTYHKTTGYNAHYLDVCNSCAYDYMYLADRCKELTEGDVFTDNQVALYYLHGCPKLLFHIYSEELIQAKTDAEIATAMDNLNVGAILLKNGADYHDYSLLPFWRYINENNNFKHEVEERSGYTIYYRVK